jgi:hypothetical protein
LKRIIPIYSIMPKKKPKGKELATDVKAWNRIVSGFRVIVEHAIGGVKRFRVVSDKFRNKKDGFDDKVMVISCGPVELSSCCSAELRVLHGKVECMILVGGVLQHV